MEKFANYKLEDKPELMCMSEIDIILNGPSSWYPCNEIYAISITEKGEQYLTDYDEAGNKAKIRERYK